MINRTVALKFWKRYGGDNEASVKNSALITSRWGWDLIEAMKLFTEFLHANHETADTFEGKEGVWRTIRGTPIFIPEGEDIKDVIDKQFKDKGPIKTKTKLKSEGVRFPEARKKHEEFIKGRENQNYTFDPTNNEGFDAFNESSAKEFYKENADGKSDLYIISATNHGGQLSRESESAFIQVKNEGSKPLIGHWVSEDTGFDYTDVSFPKNEGMKDDGAKKLLGKFNQESALVISSNGKARFLDA